MEARMKRKNRIIGFLLGFIFFYLTSYLFFESFLVSLLIGGLRGFFYSDRYQQRKEKAKIKKKTLEFREFLDLLNNSIAAGENLENAIRNTNQDLLEIFSSKDEIYIHSKEIINSLDLGRSMKLSLEDFRDRMGLEDVDIFVGTLLIAIDSGMNLSYVIENSKNIINQKIDIELEIDSIMRASNRELVIMTLLPLIIILLLKLTRPDYKLKMIDYLVRLPVFIVFIVSYRMGKKIVALEM